MKKIIALVISLVLLLSCAAASAGFAEEDKLNVVVTIFPIYDWVRDILGWQSALRGKDHWYELNFRKNPPKFSKIGLYGHNMGNPAVKIWKFGEWKNLTPKKTENAPNHILLDFGEELKSVKIRIDFPGKKHNQSVELYEIELLK